MRGTGGPVPAFPEGLARRPEGESQILKIILKIFGALPRNRII